MRRIFLLLVVAFVVSAVQQTASALVLVDQVSISEGDIIYVKQTLNNTATEYKIHIKSMEDGLVNLRVLKNGEYFGSASLMEDESYSVGNLKLTYVLVRDISFLKIYGSPEAQYNVTKLGGEEEEEEAPEVNVTVTPYPLVPNKRFLIVVEGLSKGKVILLDPNGWFFSDKFKDAEEIIGKLPPDVGESLILKVLDGRGKTVLTRLLKVRTTFYEQISATIVPKKPVRGGGIVVMLIEPISGSALLIDSFTGLSNETAVSNGIATFRIPEEFRGPLILRITDNVGRLVYQSVIELSSEGVKSKLTVSLDKTSVVKGQSVVATVKLGGKAVDATVYIEDANGVIVSEHVASGGKATITFQNVGTYYVYAKYAGRTSNKVAVQVRQKSLVLQLKTQNPEPNKLVRLHVTPGAKYVITGPGLSAPIEGTSGGEVTFTPTQEGTYTVTAVLDGQEKTLNVNVAKRYYISASVENGWLGTFLVIDVVDSFGDPAYGAVTVKDPTGKIHRLTLNDGRATLPIAKTGRYVISFAQTTLTKEVLETSQPSAVVLLLVVLGGVVLFAVAYSRNWLDLKYRLKRIVKKPDTLK